MNSERHHSRQRLSARIMSPSLRTNTWIICSLLWLSGGLWMVLHYFFQEATAFGPSPNTWEPLIMRIHGIVAVATVFLFGWIAARHISVAWYGHRNRISGIALSSIGALLVLSGYALYYLPDDQLRNGSALTHQILGVAAIAFALVHWRRLRQSVN